MILTIRVQRLSALVVAAHCCCPDFCDDVEVVLDASDLLAFLPLMGEADGLGGGLEDIDGGFVEAFVEVGKGVEWGRVTGEPASGRRAICIVNDCG